MKHVVFVLISLLLVACGKQNEQKSFVELQNPIIPGYFADPSVVEHEGKFYMYVTADPWGTEFLTCWVSDDFQDWTFNKLNWPTKEACTSPTSNSNNVWAPSVVKKGDAFYMYISVGSEIWCGKAKHPLGPWENMLGDQPMLSFDTTRFYHVIDAEAFIDDDGKAYLYWGSGWDWINGHCYAAELDEDMSSFIADPVEVTPTHYFEGPLMVKYEDKYYLTYSEGKTIDDTYEVRYAVGDHPLGPFTEATNSPILQTDQKLDVYGPGHHTILELKEKYYILYHRHSLPFVTGTAMRQTCINELEFDSDLQQIKTIVPHATQLFPYLAKETRKIISPLRMEAGSEQASHRAIDYVTDNNYSTRWEVADEDEYTSLTAVFEGDTLIDEMEIRFEYPWKTYTTTIESSSDGNSWKTVGDYSQKALSGSPVLIPVNDTVTFIRLSFNQWDKENKPSIWELRFYGK